MRDRDVKVVVRVYEHNWRRNIRHDTKGVKLVFKYVVNRLCEGFCECTTTPIQDHILKAIGMS